jgi:hypothetical protein
MGDAPRDADVAKPSSVNKHWAQAGGGPIITSQNSIGLQNYPVYQKARQHAKEPGSWLVATDC